MRLRLAGLLLLLGLVVSGLSASWVVASEHSPSYQNGFAHNAAESARPQDWSGLRWAGVPELGPSGTTLHDITRRTNGTITNANLTTFWSVGSDGYFLAFAGDDDYIDVGPGYNSNWDIAGDKFTLISLARRTADEPDSGGRVTSKSITAGTEDWGLQITGPGTDNVFRFRMRAGGSLTSLDSILETVVNQWYHVACVYDGVNMIIYIDGSPDISTGKTGNIDNQGNTAGRFFLGANLALSTRFHIGSVGITTLYDEALPASQIQEIYQDSLGIVRLAEETNVHSIQDAVAAPQVIIIGWAVPDWLAVVLSNLGLARIGGLNL